MKTILIDKIGSVTLTCKLSREVRVSHEVSCTEGSVVAVKVLTSKSTRLAGPNRACAALAAASACRQPGLA